MDEGTATVIASVVAASGSVAVAWIASRPRLPPSSSNVSEAPPPVGPTMARSVTSTPGPGNHHLVAKFLLWFLYFLVAVLLIVCGSENDIDQQAANFSAGFAILFGVCAFLLRRRIKAMPRA